MEANKQLYRKRQAIVEHPFGVIKRQWGFYYITTKKGIKRASADVGLMLVAYNLRRIFNLVDKEILKKFLRELALLFLAKRLFLDSFRAHLRTPFFANPQSRFYSSLPYTALNAAVYIILLA